MSSLMDDLHAATEEAQRLRARVAELEGGLSRMREAADHSQLNSIEKLATIGTILSTLN